MSEELHPHEVAILQAIRDGAADAHEVKEKTTVDREINYRLVEQEQSLVERGLVEIGPPRQDTEYPFPHQPKTVTLTDQGIQALASVENTDRYRDLSHEDLVDRVHDLEERLEKLESAFKRFRKRMLNQR